MRRAYFCVQCGARAYDDHLASCPERATVAVTVEDSDDRGDDEILIEAGISAELLAAAMDRRHQAEPADEPVIAKAE
jgi:hypothetical protein